MDETTVKPITHSETIRYILIALIAYAVKLLAIPALPASVQGELVNVFILLLDAAVPWAMLMAARARVKATERLKGWRDMA